MNVENVDKLIRHLESLQDSSLVGFNMGTYLQEPNAGAFADDDCGTTACLAGHAVIMEADPAELSHMNVHMFYMEHDFAMEARNILDLNIDEAEGLFYGEGYDYRATLLEAIDVLRVFRQTGIIDWSETVKRAKHENKIFD